MGPIGSIKQPHLFRLVLPQHFFFQCYMSADYFVSNFHLFPAFFLLFMVISMQTQIRFIFKAFGKDYTVHYKEKLSIDQLLLWVHIQKKKMQVIAQEKNLKAFMKKELPHQSQSQYIKLTNKEFMEMEIEQSSGKLTIQYFLSSRKESISAELNRIGSMLDDREKELKMMLNEMKDETIYAMDIISKMSSRVSSQDIQHIVEVYLFVSDPLACMINGELIPVHNDEINIVSHMDRLKRASMTDSNLTIRAKRCWGTKNKLISVLNQEETQEMKINIVQLMTEVRRIDGKLVISLEGPLGQQIWESAEEILSYTQIDLLIIIGVGVNLLKELQYAKPLILITTISLQEKRVITQHRSLLDSQNTYNDTLSQVFLESFFQNLFKRQQIGESVRLAKTESNGFGDKYVWCCCMHEHAADCSWREIIDKIGYMEAHRLFKHNFDEWKKDNFYTITFQIQSFMVGKGKTCSTGEVCCFKRQGQNKLTLHKQISNILHWNKKCSAVLYNKFDSSQKRLNRFESQEYDKPSGRKRPLTIFKLLQHISNSTQKILIIKSPTLSLAKRYLSFAKEYIQARYEQAYFCELTISKEIQIRNYLKEVLKTIKYKTKLGSRSTPKIHFYLELPYNPQKTDKYYQRFFKEYPGDMLSLAKVEGLDIEKIKILLLTCHPNFDDKYPLFKIDEPEPSEFYHYTFSKYSYEHIRNNLGSIKAEIMRQSDIESSEIQQICEEMLFCRQNQYLFLGFISLFSQDGFYLTKYGRVILQNIFEKEVVDKLSDHSLPIEVINLSDCVYLQLHKSYQAHFKSSENGYKGEFQKKQLEYYYILFRTYSELLYTSAEYEHFQGMLKLILKKEGLFSIDILAQDNTFDEVVERCKNTLSSLQSGATRVFQYGNFRHVYHLNQTEKIIQNFMKRKKNVYVATSKSIIRPVEPFILTYLFWSIIHLAWRITLTMGNHYIDKINHFQTALLLFLIRVEITIPFAEIARLQLYIMINKIPPKSEEIIKCSKEMSRLLNFLRTYSMQQHNLAQLQLSWGQTAKFKELICNCTIIAEKVIDLLQDKKQGSEFKCELQQNKMYQNFTVLEWKRQIMKMTEKKILYYFQLTKMLRSMQTRTTRNENQREFHQFRLDDLVNEFRSIRKQLPQAEQLEKYRVLIDHYLSIQLNQTEADSNLIYELKGKLSAEYLPLFQHLCQKVEQKTLFNQKGLIICARTRTILCQGKPCIMSRKRNLTMTYLRQTLQKLSLKISYFTLNTSTLSNLRSDQTNNKCEMLFLILTIDSPSSKQIHIGQDYGINSYTMEISQFAKQIKECRINILVICGKNSIKMCEELVQLLQGWQHFPNIIAFQNNKYNLCDQPYNNYQNENPEKGWQFLCNDVNQTAFDLLAITIVANINSKLSYRAWTFSIEDLEEKVTKSLKMVHTVLNQQFQCTTEVLNEMSYKIWVNNRNIDKISPGKFQDLTAKFYSSETNLHDESYYENIGRCAEVNQILEAMVKEGQRCIEIVGSNNTGKSALVQQVCWISQTKNLFKFGVFKFDLGENRDVTISTFADFFKNREFKNSQNFKINQTSVLVALDNIDDQFLASQKSILKAIKGKSVTIIYSTKKKETGQALQAILQCRNCLSINLNTISLNEVYGFLMSHIKLYNNNEGHRYSKKVVKEFTNRVNNMMKIIEKPEVEFKLYRALELLKDITTNKEEEKNGLFLNFYKNNFDRLSRLIQNVKQLKVRFT